MLGLEPTLHPYRAKHAYDLPRNYATRAPPGVMTTIAMDIADRVTCVDSRPNVCSNAQAGIPRLAGPCSRCAQARSSNASMLVLVKK